MKKIALWVLAVVGAFCLLAPALLWIVGLLSSVVLLPVLLLKMAFPVIAVCLLIVLGAVLYKRSKA